MYLSITKSATSGMLRRAGGKSTRIPLALWGSRRNYQTTPHHQGQAGLAIAPGLEDEGAPHYNVPALARETPVARRELENTPQDDVQPYEVPLYHTSSKSDRVPYWQKIERWKDISEADWLSHGWQVAQNVEREKQLYKFLNEVLPSKVPAGKDGQDSQTSQEFLQDVMEGIKAAPMSIRLTPHMLSMIDWDNPRADPLRRQFIPLKSSILPDHPKLELDSLHEADDSPVEGLVHRYQDKALFLATSVCPTYCRFCTRSYAIGANTESVTKCSLRPTLKRWNRMLEHINKTPAIQDVVVSGGDSYYLQPEQLRLLGERLLAIPHIKRFRLATKGLCVSPSRILDPEDTWTNELVRLSKMAREMGKSIAVHTHFNHPNEFTWVTREAALKLYQQGVTVRNQSVLLKGVNDNVHTMGRLIRELADNNIQPYYVYQGDMVKGVEDLRTPLQTILDLERHLRGTIAGFLMPQFVVDLPGGGGKRLAATYLSYDPAAGRSTFVAPAVLGRTKADRVYEYHDPLPVVPA